MTIHKQLQTETGRSPRGHKLAVKIPRAEPSSRLLPGKWYIHAHQIKIASGVQGNNEWLKLRTRRLVRILRKTFRANYNPRSQASRQTTLSDIRKNTTRKRSKYPNTERKNKLPPWEYLNSKQLVAASKKTRAEHPLPMQAPEPWLNPYYYVNQWMPSNQNIRQQKIPSKN